MNGAYSNFIQKVVPVKNKKIKRNSQKCFDSENSEKLVIRGKRFKKYKKTRLVEKEIYKKARYTLHAKVYW